MKRDGRRRPLSFGTVFMLTMLAAVIIGSAAVLGRLSSGASVDLSKLNMQALDLAAGNRTEEDSPGAGQGKDGPGQGNGSEAVFPGTPGANKGAEDSGSGGGGRAVFDGQSAAVTGRGTGESSGGRSAGGQDAGSQTTGTAPGTDEAERPSSGVSYTLTVGGTVCLESEILKNSRNTDTKTYDLSDMMMLLKPELQSGLNSVFMENILSGSEKANGTVAPEELAELLREAGFGAAACGYSKAYDKGAEGVEGTWMALDERGVIPTGIRRQDRQDTPEILTVNGVKTFFAQYTATVPSKTRKKMEKAGDGGMVPEASAERIAREIAAARQQGAQAVIVLLKWGKTDTKPDSSQRALAAEIAKAGADLIIGSGSRVPQGAEYLEGADGGKVLCVWSLGSLMTGDRSNVKHMSGYLLHVTVRANDKGGADVLAPEYSPVYTWKYKQDGRYYYRCLAADQPAPDGMDSEQQKLMSRADQFISEVLNGSPVARRARTAE